MKIYINLFLLLLIFNHCFAQKSNLHPAYPFNFEALDKLSVNIEENDSIVPVCNKGKFIYIDTYLNKPIFGQEFEEAYPFERNYGLVKKNGKYGIINRKGEYLIKPLYNGFNLFSDVNYGILFNDKSYFSFSQGKMLLQAEILCAEPVGPQMWGVKEGNKYCLVLKDKTKTKPIYDSVLAVSYGFAIVKKAGKIGIVNTVGKTVLPFEYEDYIGIHGFDYSFIYGLKVSDTWHYYNGLKKLYESKIKAVSLNNNVFIYDIHGLFNYLDNQGKVALPHNYRWISNNGYMAINDNDELVLFNRDKKEFSYFVR